MGAIVKNGKGPSVDGTRRKEGVRIVVNSGESARIRGCNSKRADGPRGGKGATRLRGDVSSGLDTPWRTEAGERWCGGEGGEFKCRGGEGAGREGCGGESEAERYARQDEQCRWAWWREAREARPVTKHKAGAEQAQKAGRAVRAGVPRSESH